MKQLGHILVIIVVLAAFGAAKLRFEDRLSSDMVEQRLIQPPMKEGTNLRLGQTSAAVALGGLRSLVAAIWNLRAFVHFENLNWIKLEESYEVITTLQPQTTHYWDTGAWHLHTNASVYYNENKDLSPFRRKQLRRKYIDKGSAMLEEGVRQNPDNWRLHESLARLWSDRHKLPDLPRALKYYEATLATESLPSYRRAMMKRFTFYVMTRIPGQSEAAYASGRELFESSERNHLPTLVTSLFALQNKLNVPESERIPEEKLFPSKAKQLYWLQNYRDHASMGYPMDGVTEKIDALKKELGPKARPRR